MRQAMVGARHNAVQVYAAKVCMCGAVCARTCRRHCRAYVAAGSNRGVAARARVTVPSENSATRVCYARRAAVRACAPRARAGTYVRRGAVRGKKVWKRAARRQVRVAGAVRAAA